MNAPKEETYYFLLSSIRKALIGEVTASFRAIAVEWREDTAHLFFYLKDSISDELHDVCTAIGAEVIASFSKAKVCEHIESIEYPHPLPQHSHWAFIRNENLKMNSNSLKDYEGIFHSAQYALLGKILPSIRGVAVEIHDHSASLLFYINGLEQDVRLTCEEMCQVVKKLNPLENISLSIFRLDTPHQLPEHGFNWIYLPKE